MKIQIEEADLRSVLEALESSYNPNADAQNDAITDIKEALAQPERHELQAKGKHPAPCARFCEANAFQIEIRNLKSQLAQPEQEPVAYAAMINGEIAWDADYPFSNEPFSCFDDEQSVPLYTAPPKREWVGLTRNERMDIINRLVGEDWVYAVEAIEAKLREKNT